MAYSAKAIANEFLGLANDPCAPIDPMKMQKLVYFAHGWCLALKDTPLVNEPIQAWRYGPVIRDLYNAFRDEGSGPITHPAYDFFFKQNENGRSIVMREPRIVDQEQDSQIGNEFAKSLLSEIWKVYGKFSGVQLSNLTHEVGTPWDETWKATPSGNAVITDEVMTRYFKAQAKSA